MRRRDVIYWFLAAGLAFFATAGAFLLLANLGSDRGDRQLATPRPAEEGPALTMDLQKKQLETLKRVPAQRLEVAVSNAGTIPVSGVNATLEVSSEDTALPETRFYRADVGKIGADATKTVNFEVDLSPFDASSPENDKKATEPPRTILEVRSTTPQGMSVLRTAILPAS